MHVGECSKVVDIGGRLQAAIFKLGFKSLECPSRDVRRRQAVPTLNEAKGLGANAARRVENLVARDDANFAK